MGDAAEEAIYVTDDELVMFDDMGSDGMNEWHRNIWLSVIDNRYTLNYPTIITTNYNEKDLKNYMGERCHSRLFSSENMIINLHGCGDLRQEGK